MARLFRPHIPLKVRCIVAERQMNKVLHCLPTNEYGVHYRDVKDGTYRMQDRLDIALYHVARILGCEVKDLRLDHDPPLAARQQFKNGRGEVVRYVPDANSPHHLNYRPHGPEHDGSHLIKTNVRGDHGQHPDRVLIKKARPAEKGPKPKRGPKIKSRGFDSPYRTKAGWPKRKFERRTP